MRESIDVSEGVILSVGRQVVTVIAGGLTLC